MVSRNTQERLARLVRLAIVQPVAAPNVYDENYFHLRLCGGRFRFGYVTEESGTIRRSFRETGACDPEIGLKDIYIFVCQLLHWFENSTMGTFSPRNYR